MSCALLTLHDDSMTCLHTGRRAVGQRQTVVMPQLRPEVSEHSVNGGSQL